MNAGLTRAPAALTGAGGSILRTLRRAPLLWYVVLAYAVTWGWWIPMALTGRVVTKGSWRPTHLPGEFGPLLAAVVVTAATLGMPGLRDLAARLIRWRVPVRWWLVAFSPLALFALALPVARLATGDWPAWRDLGIAGGAPATNVAAMWIILTLTTGFGEETGWRGYALPRLQRTHAPLTACLLLGVVWALWHVPAFFINETYRDMNVAMLPAFFLGIICGSIVFAWLYNRSGRSLLIVALCHGTYDLVSATRAADGLVAAVVSTAIMVAAVALAAAEVRARRRGAASVIAPRVAAGEALPAA